MTDWKVNKEISSSVFVYLLYYIHLFIGRAFMLVLLKMIAVYQALTNKAAVKASRKYLSKILSTEVSRKDVINHFYNFAIVNYDRLNFVSSNFEPYTINTIIEESEGSAHLSQIKGDGGIIVTSHVGSFDFIRCLGTFHKNQLVCIVIDAKHNSNIYNFLLKQAKMKLEVIDSSCSKGIDLAFNIYDKVKMGYQVGIMADRHIQAEPIQKFLFLGEWAYFPTGIFSLAARMDIPIKACFGLCVGNAVYDFYLYNLRKEEDVKLDEKKQLSIKLQKRYIEHLEFIVKKYPYNWFNFYDFWQGEK